MLRIFRRALLTLMVVFALPMGAQAAGPAPQVTGIAVSEQAGTTRIAIDLSQRADYRVFFLNEPMRAVIDLPPVRWQLPGAPPSPRGLIAGYRYGQFDAQTARLVIDLAAPARVRSARYDLQSGSRARHRLVVELEVTTTTAFEGQVQPWSQSVTKLVSAVSAATVAPHVEPRVSAAPPSEPTPPTATPVVMTPPPPAARPVLRKTDRRRVIVVDPGHGGVDPGAIGASGIYEKDVTLAMAREMRRQLEATGRYKVVLTRDDDIFVRLRDRIAKGRAAEAELFVSIHADSMRNRETRGASIYTLSENASDDEAAGLAARENRADIIAGVDLSHENKQVASILIDLAQRESMNHSVTFAGLLVHEFSGERDMRLIPIKPHRFAGFAVLRAPDVPSVLVELGYISNKSDEQLLTRPQHRARVAGAFVRAIDQYFQKQTR